MLGLLTPEYAVYTIWADAIHMKTMVGYPSGSVGAGVADDGANEYYTLEVRPGGSLISPPRAAGTADPNATPTKIIPIVPLLTVTPRFDRWIIHTVGYGQSLWAVAIAYGVKMDQIRDWNSMDADSIEIYAGQKLYIIAPGQIWPTLTASPAGGNAQAEPVQTLTPGWSITEEPGAATQKAAYQAAVAQTQALTPAATVVDASNVTAVAVAASNVTATSSPAGPSTASPTTAQGKLSAAARPGGDAQQSASLPLVAGISILLGGGLLLIYTFSMLRKR
jgi:LysM repeat protein